MSKEGPPTLAAAFEKLGKFNDQSALCPHCAAYSGFPYKGEKGVGRARLPGSANVFDSVCVCPSVCRSCGGVVVGAAGQPPPGHPLRDTGVKRYLWPPAIPPDKAPKQMGDAETHKEVRRDYDEARHVLDASPRAAAVMLRRCVQHVIRKELKVKKAGKGGLKKEIEEACQNPRLTGPTRGALDHVREIGNVGAHPLYDDELDLLDVTREEAEYLLWAVEMLLDDLYAKPAKAIEMAKKLEAKKQGSPGAPTST